MHDPLYWIYNQEITSDWSQAGTRLRQSHTYGGLYPMNLRPHHLPTPSHCLDQLAFTLHNFTCSYTVFYCCMIITVLKILKLHLVLRMSKKHVDKEYGASEGLSDRIRNPSDQSNVGHSRDGQKDPKHDRDGQRHPMVTQERWQQGKEWDCCRWLTKNTCERASCSMQNKSGKHGMARHCATRPQSSTSSGSHTNSESIIGRESTERALIDMCAGFHAHW